MFCPKCGTKNENAASFCVNCGKKIDFDPSIIANHYDSSQNSGMPTDHPRRDVPDFTVFAILVTILCCFPLGVFAVYFAAKARGFMESGNYEKALDISRVARIWCWTTLLAGFVVIMANVIVLVSELKSSDSFFY